jgi:hypothetical protein
MLGPDSERQRVPTHLPMPLPDLQTRELSIQTIGMKTLCTQDLGRLLVLSVLCKLLPKCLERLVPFTRCLLPL